MAKTVVLAGGFAELRGSTLWIRSGDVGFVVLCEVWGYGSLGETSEKWHLDLIEDFVGALEEGAVTQEWVAGLLEGGPPFPESI